MANNGSIETNQDQSRHGGRRNGAGRKPGSVTSKSREVAEQALLKGITPLEVMLEAMNSYRDAGELDKAAGIAKDAAPYMHAKLAAVEVTGAGGGPIHHAIEQVIVDPLDRA